MSNDTILCYRVVVKKQLQAETLTEALNQLILYNEMLQVRVENGKYVHEPEKHDRQSDKLLSVYDCSGKSTADVDTLIEWVMDTLAGEMRCERGASIKAALFNIDKGFNKLVVLSHGAITDGRGLSLILEDLYRIYEQLSNGNEVALRSVRKTYIEFIEEAAATRTKDSDDLLFGSRFRRDDRESIISETDRCSETDRRRTATFSIRLDKTLKRRLFSWQVVAFKLTPMEALAGALLRSLAKLSEKNPVNIRVKSDYRFADETLKFTVGPLTQTSSLPRDFTEERGLFSNIKKLRGILRDIPLHGLAPQLSKSSSIDQQLSLNLEYLTEEPWLGGDEWLPEGFIMPERGGLTSNYSVEIIPVFLSDGVEIVVKYKETPAVKALVDSFAANLAAELEIILSYCEEFIVAREFWLREFANGATQMQIKAERDDYGVTDKSYASLACNVEKSAIDSARLNFEADESQLLLAAYAVLVSRLDGSEDLVLLCALNKDDVNAVFPLRLNPAWPSTFRLLVEQVKGKFQRAASLGQYAFDVLSEEPPKQGRLYQAPDAGYVFKQADMKNSVGQPAIGLQSDCLLFKQEPDLTLEISERAGNFDLCFVYEKTRFGVEIIKQLGFYLNAILEHVAADADIKLEEIEFERDKKVYEMTSLLAKDAFSF